MQTQAAGVTSQSPSSQQEQPFDSGPTPALGRHTLLLRALSWHCWRRGEGGGEAQPAKLCMDSVESSRHASLLLKPKPSGRPSQLLWGTSNQNLCDSRDPRKRFTPFPTDHCLGGIVITVLCPPPRSRDSWALLSWPSSPALQRSPGESSLFHPVWLQTESVF